MTTEQSTKASRVDKGRVILTPRDWSGLRLTAEQGAVRLDQLGQWFAPGLEPAQPEPLNGPAYPAGEKRKRLPWPRDPERRLKNSYDIVRRWQAAGLARLEKPFLDAPMWCWVLRAGLDELGLPYDATFPARASLPHIYQVNHVRLQLARAAQNRAALKEQIVPPHTWVSERALAAAQGERIAGLPLGHRPDGVLQLRNRELQAVEVELTRKSYQRLQAILEELTAPDSGYSRVWYFVAEAAAPALVEARAALDDDRAARVLVYQL